MHKPTLWTIGHSTHTQGQLLALLEEHGIEAIADVRRFPGSRRHPHFAREQMQVWLPVSGIGYQWLPALGGRRRPVAGSPNSAWRNPSFQGYADHLATAEFASGYEALLEMAAAQRTSLMCSEVLWWRCHRALISDVLKVGGHEVLHILDASPPTVHPYSPAASLVDGRLSYAPVQAALKL